MKWLYGILCLFFLIIFHEFGHFLAAKLFGVKVESFSVGFGPVLLHRTVHGTDYRISLIPLGGYCGMKGEKDFQKALDENLSEISGDSDSLYGIHPFKRALIGFAGPFFNFIFAVIAYAFINGIGYTYLSYSNRILINDQVTSKVAQEAGIISGDRIIKINNTDIKCFSDLIQEVGARPDEDMIITVDRDGETLVFNLHSDINKETGDGVIGIAANPDDIVEMETPHYNFFGAIGHGFLDTINNAVLIIKRIRILFKGVNLDNSVMGPLRTTELLGSSVKEGFTEGFRDGFIIVMSLLAVISVSLFIMNLLPVPILDGGMILIAFIEIVIRRRVSPRIQYYIQFIGLAFIALLFIIGIKGDILYFLKK